MTGSSEKEGDGSEANLGETVPIGAKNDVAEGRKTMPIKVKSIGTKMMKERNDRDRMKGPIGTEGRWRLGLNARLGWSFDLAAAWLGCVAWLRGLTSFFSYSDVEEEERFFFF